jgi:signal peptidase I
VVICADPIGRWPYLRFLSQALATIVPLEERPSMTKPARLTDGKTEAKRREDSLMTGHNEVKAQTKRQEEGGLAETIKVVLQALLIALVVRTFLFQPFNIPSGSLIPTLLVGDYLFVSKYAYGYSKYSFPFSPDLFAGRVWGAMPKRGDIAVFKVPKDNATDYIKRVIGLPGDRIQMREGNLFINGEMVKREFRDSSREDEGAGYEHVVKHYTETLPGGVSHLIQTFEDARALSNNTKEFVVPPDHLFMMGDNRDNSADSREWGFVPFENLVGRAEVIFFSITTRPGSSETEPAWQIWRWPWTVRWDRLLKPVR